ncbi:MAG: helix-turn-helix domain-containing protein [Sedimentisphaerales bacterium]|jgi:DNA-binding transcriptional MerR regulator
MKTPDSKQFIISAEELSNRSGESYDTINHWTRIGLLAPERQGRTRFYNQRELNKCKRIRELQKVGHSLITIRKMLVK